MRSFIVSRLGSFGLVSIAASAFSVVGCGSDGAGSSANSAGSGSAAAGASSGGASAADPDAVVGSFIVELFGATDEAEAYTTVSGKVYDGVTPATLVWDRVASAAGCELSTPHAPYCAEPCASGMVCVADGRCAPYPAAQDLGAVKLTGLGENEITLKPIANTYQLPGDVTLPFPPAREGQALSLAVSSGPFGAFALSTAMVTPLVSTGTLTLETGEPLTVTWDPPGDASLARIRIKVDISHHGGAKGKIECDVPDSGSLQIPASLLTALVDLGVAGFPSLSVSRVTTGSASIAPGKVTFQVISSATHELVLPGVQSCNSSADCDAGKACRQDKTCTP